MPDPYHDPPPVNILADRSQDDLLDIWAANRNNLSGLLAADEVMRRLYAERRVKKETP